MTDPAVSLTLKTAMPRVWDTRDVASHEAFDYYREAASACFMPLRPELEKDARPGFRSGLQSWQLPKGVLNVVSASPHVVLRTQSEIAASPESAIYVNLQISGRCVIHQGSKSIALGIGDVGMFDADTPFKMEHFPRSQQRVASFLLPRAVLPQPVERGLAVRLNNHPVLGGVLTEAARALANLIPTGADTRSLHGIFLSLVTGCLEVSQSATTTTSAAQRARIYALIRVNAIRCRWSLTECAADIGLSPRQVQRLLTDDNNGFAALVVGEKLRRASLLLRDPAHRHRPVADIALLVGYSDAAPFSRAFRKAYGQPPDIWRRLDTGTDPSSVMTIV